MKRSLLKFLECPACKGELELREEHEDASEIMAGSLDCGECGQRFRIDGGVPRFAPMIADDETRRTVEAFGFEWNRYSTLAAHYRQQFLDWLKPVDESFFVGKLVLEGGCGKGRHTAMAAEFGAKEIVAIDLSNAVDVAFRNTLKYPNVHVVQADIHRPPLKRVFDYAFSVGVLHHLEDPEAGFRSLVSRVKPGGHASAWVYGREGNGWIVHLLNPVRERITSRMPYPLLNLLSGLAAIPLFGATKLLYGPLGGRVGRYALPYGEYLTYISRFPFTEQRSIVFDHLVAPTAFYLRREEFLGWFERLGSEGTRIEHHNGNSWRGFARMPGLVEH